jgi:predicted RNA-binding Zn-ribbon protein involved in translation (DUF1610 family)
MIAEFAAALGTIKTSVDLLKTLHNASEDEKIRTAVFEIQNDLLSLQTKLFEANARFEEQSAKLGDLRKELNERDNWDEEAKKYELFHPAEGMSAYKLRAEYNNSGGEVWVCPHCFGNRKISILNKPGAEYRNYKCHPCGFDIMPIPRKTPTVRSSGPGRPKWGIT